MALHDYEADDEEDFYGQPFDEGVGFVSVWLGQDDPTDYPEELDVLHDLCGVGFYDASQQDANAWDGELVDIPTLVAPLSFAHSYLDALLAKASKLGITSARWVVAQYDFAYDPAQVKRPIADDPIFIGSFPYEADEAEESADTAFLDVP